MEKIAIIFGGISLEHEVSVITGLQVIENFVSEKYTAIPIYIDKKGNWWTGDELKKKAFYAEGKNENPEKFVLRFSLDFGSYATDIKAAILCLHGGAGEGGGVQGILEAANIPYQGPNVASSALAMDKIFTRQVLSSENISQPDFYWFNESDYLTNKNAVIENAKELKFPLYLKVATSGSSIGVHKVMNETEISNAMEELILYGDRFILEQEIMDCIEINISVMGHHGNSKASSSEQPTKSADILSFEEKYQKGGKKGGMAGASRRIPAPISSTAENKLKEVAKQIFRILNLEGVVRIDFFVNPSSEEYYVIEVNTIPGSLSYYLWEFEGVSFTKLIDDLIQIAEFRHDAQARKITSFENNLLKID